MHLQWPCNFQKTSLIPAIIMLFSKNNLLHLQWPYYFQKISHAPAMSMLFFKDISYPPQWHCYFGLITQIPVAIIHFWKYISYNKMSLQIVYLMYLYKQDLALNILQWLICYKTQ